VNVAILEPGRNGRRRIRPTGRQLVVGTLWGFALGIALLIVVGEVI
jgi:hypothetical protein